MIPQMEEIEKLADELHQKCIDADVPVLFVFEKSEETCIVYANGHICQLAELVATLQENVLEEFEKIEEGESKNASENQ